MKQFVGILVLGLMFVGKDAMGQQVELARDTGEFLMPPAKNLSYESVVRMGFNKQEQTAMRAGMFKVLEVLHELPILNPPRGWAVGSSAVLGWYEGEGRTILTGSTTTIFKGYYKNLKTGKVTRDVEGPSFEIYFNDIDVIVSQQAGIAAGSFINAPLIPRYVQGFPVYKNRYVVITKSNAPLFLPVSQEAFLRKEIGQAQERVDQAKKSITVGMPSQRWAKDKKQQIDEFMSSLKYTEQENPAKAKADKEKFLLQMQKNDSMFKSFDAQYLKDAQGGLDRAMSDLRKLEEQLAALSPQERQAQSMGYDKVPQVRINRDFFNPKMPRSAIQLIVVDLFK